MAKKKYNVIREEMLQVASNVAQEKNIDQDSVFSAMEQALEKAARVKYGQEIDIRISIDILISISCPYLTLAAFSRACSIAENTES